MKKLNNDKVLQSLPTAIVGSGIAGLAVAFHLKKRKVPFVIFEKNSSAGGTWFENNYPGCRSDIPSHLYSFSFSPNPNWSKKMVNQGEFLQYLKDVVQKNKLLPYIRFNTVVQSAVFDEETGLWKVCAKMGESKVYEEYFKMFVSAVGQLNKPKLPEIEGLESFKGRIFHTARFPDDVNFKNKNVGIIGNAASAVQIIPKITTKVRHLHVFQRTPNDMIPQLNSIYPKWMKKLFSKMPFVMRLYRWWLYWENESYYIMIRFRILRKFLGKYFRWRMKLTIGTNHPQLIESCIPRFEFTCKRILRSNEYLHALKNDNVNLVTSKIEKINAQGIVTKKQTYPFDIIILATGFDVNKWLRPITITNKTKNKSLSEIWEDNPQAYLGMALPDFPNFFILYGPNTNLLHTSVTFMLERQARYCSIIAEHLYRSKSKLIRLKRKTLEKYTLKIKEGLMKIAVVGDCSNWYQNKEGKVTSVFPFSTVYYWFKTQKVNYSEYEEIERTEIEVENTEKSFNDRLN